MRTVNKKNDTASQPTGNHERAENVHAAERKAAEAAHNQAEHDIAEDADLSIHSPNDDLDEGEISRLGEDVTKII
jgi:hypothetical protein